MSLGRLTSSEAVVEAIREHDLLGRAAFLKRYGFRGARRYVLEWKGRPYDSKAIVGVAFGFQFPKHGPLRPDQFSGGRDSVARKLAELGFVVKAR